MKKNIFIPIIIILISSTSIAGIFWYTFKITKLQNSNQQNIITKTEQSTQNEINTDQQVSEVDVFEEDVEEIDTSNWKTYRNEEYGFEFKYPEDNEVVYDATNYGGSVVKVLDKRYTQYSWDSESFPLAAIQYFNPKGVYLGYDLSSLTSFDQISNYLISQFQLCSNIEYCNLESVNKKMISGRRSLEIDISKSMSNRVIFIERDNESILVITNFFDADGLFDLFIDNFKFLD